jgi:hypothetical protein
MISPAAAVRKGDVSHHDLVVWPLSACTTADPGLAPANRARIPAPMSAMIDEAVAVIVEK